MGKLFEQVRQAVADGRYVIGEHAGERLDERQIPDWQVVDGVGSGKLLRERPRDKPNPVVEIEQILADGTLIRAVWSWLPRHRAAKLVTVYRAER